MAETNGQVARRRMAGKGIGSEGIGSARIDGEGIGGARIDGEGIGGARIDGARIDGEGIGSEGIGSEGIGRDRIGSERIDGTGIDTAPQKTAPERVTSTTHVNVALPFAKLEVHEPSEHLLALTTLVQDLAGLLARTTPSPEAEDLLRRAEELAAKIR